MRRAILLLCAGTVLLVAAAHLYRDPRVRDLFQSPSRGGPVKNRLVRVRSSSSSPLQTPRKIPAVPEATPSPAESAAQQESAPVRIVQSPNDVVSRVLLAVLAAKGLGSGVSLQVSDEAIRVIGEARSAEERDAVIRLVEKGREARRVDASGLVVGN